MSVETTDLAQALRDAGLRATQQRMLLLSILMESADHPNADELYLRGKAVDNSVSLATVYRTLTALEEVGLIRRLNFENEPARFEITPVADHDHLVDIDSGEVIELACDDITRLRQQMIEGMGYEIVSQHTLIRVRKRPGR